MRKIRQELEFVDDVELIAYVNQIGQNLARNSDQPSRMFTFYLVRDSTLNAFAVPGGHITLHTGLITTTQHEAELASVIAHEIAHITQSHIARMVARAKRQNLPAMAALIAAILIGGQAGSAAIAATQAGLIEQQLAYSRSFEQEADTIGIATLARASYDPRAMPAFFNRLQQYGRSQESNAPEFLRTHPLTYNRIVESVSRAENYPRIENPDETKFLLMQAKIRALYGGTNPAKTADSFAARIQTNSFAHLAVEQYGHALALAGNGEYDAARAKVSALLEADPGQISYAIALGQIELAAGRAASAVKVYRAAQQRHPDNLILDLYFVEALISNKEYAEAKQILKRHLLVRRGDPRLHRLLARTEGESGNNLAAHQELAEFHYYNGDLREALRQLHLAKKYTGDSFYAQSSVDARIEEIQQRLISSGEKL